MQSSPAAVSGGGLGPKPGLRDCCGTPVCCRLRIGAGAGGPRRVGVAFISWPNGDAATSLVHVPLSPPGRGCRKLGNVGLSGTLPEQLLRNHPLLERIWVGGWVGGRNIPTGTWGHGMPLNGCMQTAGRRRWVWMCAARLCLASCARASCARASCARARHGLAGAMCGTQACATCLTTAQARLALKADVAVACCIFSAAAHWQQPGGHLA